MKTLAEIQRQLAAGEFGFSHHAQRRAVRRNISAREIEQAGTEARAIEDYPGDKYGPSCLLLGYTDAGRPLHIQVLCMETELVRIITVYEPDPKEWISDSKRR